MGLRTRREAEADLRPTSSRINGGVPQVCPQASPSLPQYPTFLTMTSHRPQNELDGLQDYIDAELLEMERLSKLETEKNPSDTSLDMNHTLCDTIDPINFQDLMTPYPVSVSHTAAKAVYSDLGWLAMSTGDGTASVYFNQLFQANVTATRNPFEWNGEHATFTSPFVGLDHTPENNLINNNRPTPSNSTVQHHNRRKEKVHCTHQGCTKTFGRPNDLRRHLKLHISAPDIPCTAEGCKRMFYRMDNRRAHERRVHKVFA
ncbi:hypothetical protein BGW36DRAFT_388471 [Talaromyces proteolyticus]|uniref:C2H2-type domain-containing protein n=1 Tax=Talaromyces proteolyticus TaxID=1131652 RepID=A0AAD4PTY0_9EURO|nr:uncharacterized protein BGW36DRAFT_388471 [Talaromyces proteolyticus]KAH8691520.1 hypothetical protein BGW36DRAFT_388471 [Talaromyces proteolyticus]